MTNPIPGVILGTVIEFLRRFPPFNDMDAESLGLLAAGARLGYFHKGSLILGPQDGIARTLYIVQRGTVRARAPGSGEVEDHQEFSSGEAFPIPAVLGAQPVRSEYHALEDSFCYEIAAATVEELMRRSPPFQRFCTRRLNSLLQQMTERLRHAYGQRAAGNHSMLSPLKMLLKRPPVACLALTPLRDALVAMQANKVSSIVVTSPDGRPEGIFTERDLLKLTVEGRVAPDRPIAEFMTPDPVGLPSSATASDAAVAMARQDIRHMLVIDEGRLAGVVSERSLFALQRLSMRQVTQAIELAVDRGALVSVAAEIRSLEHGMLAQGVAAEQLTQLIATLNDKLTERIVLLEANRGALDGIRWCWLALGSEGRLEQTFATDQDNAIVFDTGGRIDEARAGLLRLGKAVNAMLDACGFPLCKGNVMAGNPECCLSMGEWKEKFSNWVRNPSSQALLNATIYFDFRPLAGDAALAQDLRHWLREAVRDDERFFHTLAANALQARPPLGFFRAIVTSGSNADAHTVDLKGQGSRVFVDAARIYALKSGIEQTGTAARLRLAGHALAIPESEIEAMVEAFYYQLLLRLRHQHAGAPESGDSVEGHNRIDPEELNDLDRRILKESFMLARRLQQRLAMDYGL